MNTGRKRSAPCPDQNVSERSWPSWSRSRGCPWSRGCPRRGRRRGRRRRRGRSRGWRGRRGGGRRRGRRGGWRLVLVRCRLRCHHILPGRVTRILFALVARVILEFCRHILPRRVTPIRNCRDAATARHALMTTIGCTNRSPAGTLVTGYAWCASGAHVSFVHDPRRAGADATHNQSFNQTRAPAPNLARRESAFPWIHRAPGPRIANNQTMGTPPTP